MEQPLYLVINPVCCAFTRELLQEKLVKKPNSRAWEFKYLPILLFHAKHSNSIKKYPIELRKYLRK